MFVWLAVVPQLVSAEITVTLAGDTARVEARFAVARAGDSMRASLMRFPGQVIGLPADEKAGAAAALPGLIWLRPRPARAGELELRYTVVGSLDRIPLPVPTGPLPPGLQAARIVVRGESVARAEAAFPRLRPASDGGATGRLDNVPGFLRLSRQGGLTVDHVARVVVVLLLLGGSAAWLRIARRNRPGRGGALP
jgi:hypothetical protein